MSGIKLQCDECKTTFDYLSVAPNSNQGVDFKFNCPNCGEMLQYPLVYAGRGYVLHSLRNTPIKFQPVYLVFCLFLFIVGVVLSNEMMIGIPVLFAMFALPTYLFRANRHCYPVVCGKPSS